MEKVTVGVLFNNEYTDINDLFRSLYTEVGHISEVIVISNKANDKFKLQRIISDHLSKFRIIVRYYNFNTGAASGRNKLINLCTTKYMMFCDSDLTVTEGLIGVLLNTIKSYKNIYAVIPRMYFGGTNKIWWAGNYDKHIHTIINIMLNGNNLNWKLKFGSFITTCCLIDVNEFRKKDLWFDSEFFVYCEDVEITEFLKDNIYCLFQPEALAYHNIQLKVTGNYFDIFRNYITFRNRMIMGIKHIDSVGLLITVIHHLKMLELPFKLKLRAFLFGVKLGLFKLFGFYKGKIIDSREYKFIQKFSNNRLILR